jgi:hypothetical protein
MYEYDPCPDALIINSPASGQQSAESSDLPAADQGATEQKTTQIIANQTLPATGFYVPSFRLVKKDWRKIGERLKKIGEGFGENLEKKIGQWEARWERAPPLPVRAARTDEACHPGALATPPLNEHP